MTRLFGTDGVRGIANTELSPHIAFKLGQAAGIFLGNSIVVGKDTRKSGDMLEAALVAGIMSVGACAFRAGILPTPGIALLVRELSASGGVVISASHNPPEYNGIKFFDADGFKLSDKTEEVLEAFVCDGVLPDAHADFAAPDGLGIGISCTVDRASEIYVEHVVASIRAQGIDFSGLNIALDLGHGAACVSSAQALRSLGARLTCINDDFDGTDINVECGSTHLEPLAALMDETHADIGIAHDGDADRVILMAPDKTVIDGDYIEAVCALDMKARGYLAHDTVVSTVMANLGFVRAMKDAGIAVEQTCVGDRYVLEAMRKGEYSIGGEQSGHMIMLDHNSTGDGLMTACQFLAAWRRSGKALGDLLSVMEKYPQVLVNVQVHDKAAAPKSDAVCMAVKQAEAALGETGRVLLRPSGTEPLVRVMVEAADYDEAKRHADTIAKAVASCER